MNTPNCIHSTLTQPTLQPTIEPPSQWMRDGYSPTEIILAVAILTSASLSAIGTLILCLTRFARALTPNQTSADIQGSDRQYKTKNGDLRLTGSRNTK